jgi:Predicted phosphohydrolases
LLALFLYLAVFAVPYHLYIFLKIRAAFPHGRQWKAWVLWSLLFLLVPVVIHFDLLERGRGREVLFALAITEYVTVGMASVAFAALDVLRLLLSLRDKRKGTCREKWFTPRRVLAIGAAATALAFAYCYYEAWNVRTVYIEIPTAKLPAGVERLRIVHLTDVHIGGIYPAERLKRLMEAVRAAQPDLFVVTGDLVDGDMRGRDREAAWIADSGAKYGAFAVDGNHEYAAGLEQAYAFMERAGLRPLHDEVAEAAGIVIVGLDSAGGYELWPLEPLPQDRFVLVLKHYPQVAARSAGNFDLQLSGHTHGGQLWPLAYAMKRSYGQAQGLEQRGGGYVYVGKGAGFWAAPLRFLTPPETAVIDLVRAP